VPGDKSISHRAAMIGAIAQGVSHLKNYSTAADCASTLSCLEGLGVRIERNQTEIVIHGIGRNGFSQPPGDLDCGNSGTTTRLLAGILAGQDVIATLTGDQSLRSRPMRRIIEPLEMMGAAITSDQGRAPLQIKGRQPLHSVDYELLTASAQVKSCILLAGLNSQGKTTVVENQITRDHTERMLQWFGVTVESGTPSCEPQNARFAAVTGPAQLSARDVSIPGDISSAAYFIAAAGLLGNSSLEIVDIGLNPTRTEFLKQLNRAGVAIATSNERERCNEPIGTLQVLGQSRPDNSAALAIEGTNVARLIDELPLLAVFGSQQPHGIEIRGAKELRVKESDRIAATVQGLRAMGCRVEEFEDGLRVHGPTKLRGARIDSHGDHRIAMSFTIAGLIAEGETEIIDADCVSISFPEFFNLLESVIER
jgi:3-phosphoshikimate 1-carboxyvinyltransferase